MFLEQIGADARVAGLFRPHAAEGLELGRVSFAAREQYRIYLDGGECEAVPAGRLRWSEALPAVGDWVAAQMVPEEERAVIQHVLRRRTAFTRKAAGQDAAQVVAANVDAVVVVTSLNSDFNPRRLERYLVLAWESGAAPVVVLNKADLCDAVAERLEAATWVAGGARILVMSAAESVEPIEALVRGRTVVFLGSSGVGKSTLINALLGEERQATTEVRAADSKGRHTTTSRMLMPLPGGGALIDTPGMRELQLWASEESLDDVFAEIAEAAARCRFGDCTHTAEPGCAVLKALESGAINGGRWASYRKLQAEVRRRASRRTRRRRRRRRAAGRRFTSRCATTRSTSGELPLAGLEELHDFQQRGDGLPGLAGILAEFDGRKPRVSLDLLGPGIGFRRAHEAVVLHARDSRPSGRGCSRLSAAFPGWRSSRRKRRGTGSPSTRPGPYGNTGSHT